MDFVWIYAKPFSYFAKRGTWNELEYSIKSVKKNYPKAVCWVVGDDPGLDVNWIKTDRVITHPSNHPIDIDVIRKFRTIIDSDINEEFVLMYDDIFLIKPVTRKDLEVVYGRCKIDNVNTYSRPWSTSYRRLWQKTYKMIQDITENVYDWETHLPRFLEKYALKQVLDAYMCDENPLIATSLYSAHFAEETKVLTNEQSNLLNTVVDIDKAFDCTFMNIMDDTITLEFKNKMTELFGEGTSFKPAYRRH